METAASVSSGLDGRPGPPPLRRRPSHRLRGPAGERESSWPVEGGPADPSSPGTSPRGTAESLSRIHVELGLIQEEIERAQAAAKRHVEDISRRRGAFRDMNLDLRTRLASAMKRGNVQQFVHCGCLFRLQAGGFPSGPTVAVEPCPNLEDAFGDLADVVAASPPSPPEPVVDPDPPAPAAVGGVSPPSSDSAS